MSNLNQLTQQIEAILKNEPETRNCDKKLTNWIWYTFYNDKIFKDKEGKLSVRLIDLYDLPANEAIKRIRAKIQNDEEKYLPTDEEVARKRKWNIGRWRELLGY